MTARLISLTLCGLFAITLAGCGESTPGPELIPVSGKLVRNNQPLSQAFVEFVSDTGVTATATTDETGAFELAYHNGNIGTVEGTYTVKVTTAEELKRGAPVRNADGMEMISPNPPQAIVLPAKVTVKDPVTSLELQVPAKS